MQNNGKGVLALPTGEISMSQVNTELGHASNRTINFSDVRVLAGKPSGAISMNDLRGKANKLFFVLNCVISPYQLRGYKNGGAGFGSVTTQCTGFTIASFYGDPSIDPSRITFTAQNVSSSLFSKRFRMKITLPNGSIKYSNTFTMGNTATHSGIITADIAYNLVNTVRVDLEPQ